MGGRGGVTRLNRKFSVKKLLKMAHFSIRLPVMGAGSTIARIYRNFFRNDEISRKANVFWCVQGLSHCDKKGRGKNQKLAVERPVLLLGKYLPVFRRSKVTTVPLLF